MESARLMRCFRRCSVRRCLAIEWQALTDYAYNKHTRVTQLTLSGSTQSNSTVGHHRKDIYMKPGDIVKIEIEGRVIACHTDEKTGLTHGMAVPSHSLPAQFDVSEQGTPALAETPVEEGGQHGT